MREIKFRAWDKKYKRLIYFDLLDLDGGVYLDDDKSISVSDCPIMQYTGLKDKNGKEIYEGDVVRIEGLISTAVFAVEYGKQEFGDDAYEAACIGFNLDPTEERHEVIGNCFENPELLGDVDQ